MPAFLIADIGVTDPDTYADYRKANPDIVTKLGGRYIALGGEIKVLEGDWKPRLTVIIEIADMSAINAHYESSEYTELRKIRWKSADSRLVAIEALPEPVDRP